MEKLFKSQDHAKLYASYRPSYPPEIYERITSYHSDRCPSHGLAVDVGCGTGISTVELSPYFQRVIGVDVSEAQISQINQRPDNVTFKVSSAYDMAFLAPGSVDLITVAATIHWLDTERFYREAQRVLRPNGTLAIYTYQLRFSMDNEEAERILFDELYYGELGQAGHDTHRTKFLDYFYSEQFKMPFKDLTRVADIPMTRTWSLDQVAGYFSTLSGYQTYIKQNPQSTALQDTIDRLKKFYGDDSSRPVVHIRWTPMLVLGRN